MSRGRNQDSKGSDLRKSAEERLCTRSEEHYFPLNMAEATRLLHELQVHQIELEMQNEELRRAENEAKEYAAELAAIYQHAPFIMLLLDANRRVIKANGLSAEFVAQQAEQMIGARIGEALRCIHSLDDPHGCGLGPSCPQCPIRRVLLDTLDSGSIHNQKDVSFVSSATDNPARYDFLLSSVRLVFRGEPVVLVSLLDITESKQAQTDREQLAIKLRQSEKMSAVGQLAAGIAHNFNNQLGGIIGYADLLLAKLTDEGLRHYVAGIISASRRASDLTTQLLDFSRKGKTLAARVDLHRLIHETAALLGNSIDKRIEISLQLDADQAIVVGDPTQLQNCLLNLGLNARDSMPQGGQLRFVTAEIDVAGEPAAALGIGPGRYLLISVSDSGAGMNPETQKHLFEPFFTTKGVGKGTGLGLAALYGAILSHHGAITVQSQEGHGSTFALYLPLAEKVADTRVVEPATAPAKGQGHILLIDDEKVVLDMCSDMLRYLGYDVTAYADGAEAVEQYRNCWKTIDMVILDIIMPRMSGRDIYVALRDINPKVKALVSSGYSSDNDIRAILEDGALDCIHKPFNLLSFSRKVTEVLQR